jgi:hypothetical protein
MLESLFDDRFHLNALPQERAFASELLDLRRTIKKYSAS